MMTITIKINASGEGEGGGFVALVSGLSGAVVAQGASASDALVNACSAVKFHVETFGEEAIKCES